MSVRPCKYCTSLSELSGREQVGRLPTFMYIYPSGRKGARVAAAYQVSPPVFIAGSARLSV